MLQNIIKNIHTNRVTIEITQQNRFNEKEVLKQSNIKTVSPFQQNFNNLYEQYKQIKVDNYDAFMYAFACHTDKMLSLYENDKYRIAMDFTQKSITEFDNLQLYKKYKLRTTKYTADEILASLKHDRKSVLPALYYFGKHLDVNIIFKAHGEGNNIDTWKIDDNGIDSDNELIIRVNKETKYIMVVENSNVYEINEMENIDEYLITKYRKIENIKKLLVKDSKVILGNLFPTETSEIKKLNKSDLIDKLVKSI